MQQTTKYQFNLVDSTDDFSPTPLNQNMEKVEEELEGLEEALASEVETVMDNLGTIGHNLRIQTGSYVGTGTYGQSNPKSLTFDLYPVVVMIAAATDGHAIPPCILMRGIPISIFSAGSLGSDALYVTWGEHSVSWYSKSSTFSHANEDGATYRYLVLGY